MNKPRLWTLVALAGCAAALAGCAGKKGDTATLPMDESVKSELKVFWQTKVQLDKKAKEKVLSLHRCPGRIYALTNRNRLLAVDAFSGHYLWAVELGDLKLTPSAPVQVGRVVFVTLLERLYGYSVIDGSRVLYRELDGAPTAQPVVHGEYFYYGTHEGWLKAVNLFDPSGNWVRNVHASIVAAPATDGERVYFASIEGRVFGSTYNRRQTIWEFQTDGAVVADLKQAPNGLVLVPCRDYTLYALNPHNGLPAWIATTGDPLEKPAHVREGRVYIVKKSDDLLALAGNTGKADWSAAGTREFIAASTETVFTWATDGALVALAASDGRVKFRLDAEDLTLSAANDIDGQLFIGAADGEIVCVREKKITYNDPTTAVAREQAEP